MRILAIVAGGGFGALIRWLLGLALNPIFPTIPFGTLAANLLGGYLIGVMMGLIDLFPTLPDIVRLALITGFLGGLTTFSTFSAETVSLISTKSYSYAMLHIILHVVGSIALTIAGVFSIKFILSSGVFD